MLTSLLVALTALIIASLLAGYRLDDLYKGCAYAVLSYCALATLYEGRTAAFTVQGLTSVISMYAVFFLSCICLAIVKNMLVMPMLRQRWQKQEALYETHHRSDEATGNN